MGMLCFVVQRLCGRALPSVAGSGEKWEGPDTWMHAYWEAKKPAAFSYIFMHLR